MNRYKIHEQREAIKWPKTGSAIIVGQRWHLKNSTAYMDVKAVDGERCEVVMHSDGAVPSLAILSPRTIISKYVLRLR